jgi:type I restriction enzyme S subunit
MFGDPVDNDKNWPTSRLSDIAVSRLGKMLDKRKQTGQHQHKYLANANVQWFSFDLENLNQMDFDEADQKEFELLDGDLLVCEGGEIGRCAIWHGEITDCYFQKAIHRVRCNTEVLLPDYLGHSFYYHSQKNGFSDIVSSKSTIAHLPGDKLKAMNIIVPPMELQKRFIAFLEQSDKSKFVYQEASNWEHLRRIFSSK